VLRTRLLTAAVALPLLLAIIFFLPPVGFSIFIGIVGLWGLYEVVDMVRALSKRHSRNAGGAVGLVALGAIVLIDRLASHDAAWILPILIILLMMLLVAWVGMRGSETVPKGIVFEIGFALLGYESIAVLFPFFAFIRNGANGIAILLLMLLLVILADTGAYFVGRAIGRHKLAFKVSPGKTIEGAIGGIIASIAGGLILRPWLVPQWNIDSVIIFAAMVAILAIIGDLANSAFKRVAGVKDSGWIFPGHGGLLDRTCSLVFAAVLTYYYSR